MIRTLTARTAEIDDIELAVMQITSQLNDGGGFLANSIGIAACHYEFVLSGIFKAVCAALPFETIGTITSSQSVADKTDSLLFTLTVMTSDAVEFDAALTPPLITDPGKVVAESYKSAVRRERPAMILVFAPFILQNSGDEYVNVISEVSGGVPCFGTLAIDDTDDYSNCFMLAGGEHYRDRMAMAFIYGDISPKFYVANISYDRILEKNAVVTKSAGHVLMEVNERPVIEYFEDLGLVQASETQYAMSTLPFLLDYNDGTPRVSKTFVALTPEKYAICAGAMPEGSALYMASADKNDVLLTTREAAGKILKDIEGASGLLIYSCISRSIALGSEQFREMELIRSVVGAALPFMMACSGGEICPTRVSEEKAVNRFHNNAFIACLF